jgi:hypothetical protein
MTAFPSWSRVPVTAASCLCDRRGKVHRVAGAVTCYSGWCFCRVHVTCITCMTCPVTFVACVSVLRPSRSHASEFAGEVQPSSVRTIRSVRASVYAVTAAVYGVKGDGEGTLDECFWVCGSRGWVRWKGLRQGVGWASDPVLKCALVRNRSEMKPVTSASCCSKTNCATMTGESQARVLVVLRSFGCWSTLPLAFTVPPPGVVGAPGLAHLWKEHLRCSRAARGTRRQQS